MTAPTDPIRREDVERAIRARQSITQDPMIYAGLSVALQEIAALPADPVAEAAGKLAEKVVRDGLADFARVAVACRYDCEHAECLSIRYRAAVAARAKEST